MERLKTRIITKTLILASGLSIFFFALRKNLLALGVLIGVLTAITCFHLLARHILGSTFVGLQKIKPYFFLKYLIRYAIMGAVLFLCAKVGLNLFLGAAVGLLLIPLVAKTGAKS